MAASTGLFVCDSYQCCDRVRHDLYKDRAKLFMCSSMSLFAFTSTCSGLVNMFTSHEEIHRLSLSLIHSFVYLILKYFHPSIYPFVNSSIHSFVCASIHPSAHLLIYPSSQPLIQRLIDPCIKPSINSSINYLPFQPSILQPHPKRLIKCCDKNIP